MVAPMLLQALAAMGNVAKVDIRGTGTPSEAILKQQLASTYATAGIPGAGQLLPTSDIALNTAISGSYVLEVDSSQATADALTNFWCLHADQKALFETMIEMPMVGLTVTEIITCTGASGTGCTESTCGSTNGGGDVDDDGTPDPAPEPEPAPAPDGGSGDKDDDNGLSTVAIVLIVIGILIAAALLLYLLWPWIETCWKPRPTAQKLAEGAAVSGSAPLTGACIDLPPLYSPA